jgi:hypothetical protein
MAFNPFVTFQKNKRFWMAAILMVCMVSFVFCTGMRGGMEDFFQKYTRSSGPTAVSIDGRNISRRDLEELRMQRNLANAFMKNCNDIAYKNTVKMFAEMHRRTDDKDVDKRKEALAFLENVRRTLSSRKARTRYFDGGVKFDDLIEFKLWQLEADRLGIKIEDAHFQILFDWEFFNTHGFASLKDQEIQQAVFEARHAGDRRDASDSYIRRAVAEEFRVRIVQYALLTAQPSSFYGRRNKEGQSINEPKFIIPEMPDEVRAPLTLAQVFDFFKAQQATFSVSLVPVRVQDFLDKIKEPDDIQKEGFFNASKGDAFDPSSDKWGVEIPPRASFEFLIADPMEPRYLELARRLKQLDVSLLRMPNPVAFDPAHSALLTAMRDDLIQREHLKSLEQHLKVQVSRVDRFNTAALYTRDCTTPILTHFAGRHPQAAASLIAGAFASPEGALAGYVAWGTIKAPLEGTIEAGKTKLATNTEEQEAAFQSEANRRARAFGSLFLSSTGQSPLDLAFPYLAMDIRGRLDDIERFGARVNPNISLHLMSADEFGAHPHLTVETVRHELEEMIAKQTARDWAQANIIAAKKALDKASGDPDKFSIALNKLMQSNDMKLIYGPEGNKKREFHDRFSVNEAPEFAKLKEAFREYVPKINMYEGREAAPRKLREEDFPRMLFDPTEPFAASVKHKAMPWPPDVKLNTGRDVSAALAQFRHVDEVDRERFKSKLYDVDPYKEPEVLLKLYESADRPMLFWRTDEIPAQRATDFKKLTVELAKAGAERKRLEEELKKTPQDADLQAKFARAAKEQSDKQFLMNRVAEGFKFERARKDEALPKAKEIAKALVAVDPKNALSFMKDQASKLPDQGEVITLTQSLLQGEQIDQFRVDYFPPSLPKEKVVFPRDLVAKDMPKDKIVFPRDDMMKDLLNLIELKEPIKIETSENKDRPGVKELDEINKALFEQGKDLKRYVQIIPNRPRSVFYVATVTSPPSASTALFPLRMQAGPRDLLISRAQEQEARAYRARYIEGLKALHKVSGEDPETRKLIDGDRD